MPAPSTLTRTALREPRLFARVVPQAERVGLDVGPFEVRGSCCGATTSGTWCLPHEGPGYLATFDCSECGRTLCGLIPASTNYRPVLR